MWLTKNWCSAPSGPFSQILSHMVRTHVLTCGGAGTARGRTGRSQPCAGSSWPPRPWHGHRWCRWSWSSDALPWWGLPGEGWSVCSTGSPREVGGAIRRQGGGHRYSVYLLLIKSTYCVVLSKHSWAPGNLGQSTGGGRLHGKPILIDKYRDPSKPEDHQKSGGHLHVLRQYGISLIIQSPVGNMILRGGLSWLECAYRIGDQSFWAHKYSFLVQLQVSAHNITDCKGR